MLLIGDIHITSKYSDAIIDSIRTYVEGFSDEKNIVFLGDYMYMFSYDRRALGKLFDLFLELWQKGKNLYILAGNHDRIGQQFVFAEWKKIADMLPQMNGHVIRFITTPELHEIEWKEVLFFPFSKHFSVEAIDNIMTPENSTKTIEKLLESKNSNERLSGAINLELRNYINAHKNLTIIHHYYIADTKFPGQQALFDYKDIALCPDLLENQDIKLISGHIHMPFAYKNYLCAGSLWYTSPLEQDHHKFLFQRNAKTGEINGTHIAINPYVVLPVDNDEKISTATLQNHKKMVDKKISETFGGNWEVSNSYKQYPLSQTTVTLLSEKIGYEHLQEHIDPELFTLVKEWSIKKKNIYGTDMSFTLETAQRNLQESLIDRKIIVKNFIMSRFWEDFDKYRTLLDELHILS